MAKTVKNTTVEGRYERIRELVERGMGVVQAIHKVAKEDGVGVSGVQASYYKLARDRGTTRGKRGVNRTFSPRENMDTVMDRIMGAVSELVERNKQLESDARRLRDIENVLS